MKYVMTVTINAKTAAVDGPLMSPEEVAERIEEIKAGTRHLIIGSMDDGSTCDIEVTIEEVGE